MEDNNGSIQLNIDIGDKIQAVVTHKAYSELKLSLNTDVWVSFKSTSVMALQ